jgi:hypothetical protein
VSALRVLCAALLLSVLVDPAAHAAPARDCPVLQGAAAEMFDSVQFCRHLAEQIARGEPLDLRKAAQQSVRQSTKAHPAHELPRPVHKTHELVHLPNAHAPHKKARPPKTAHPAKPTQPVQPVQPPKPVQPPAAPRDGNLPLTLLGAAALLLALVAARRLLARAAPGVLGFAAPPVRPVPVPGSGAGPQSALAFEEALSSTTGIGVVGAGAEGFLRAALVELLTRADRKVVLSRAELNRLFGGSLGPDLLEALSPRLHVCDRLEDVIEHLELEVRLDADRTYWIAPNSDAVLPLLEGGHRLRGLLLGAWRHGPTTVIDSDGTVPGHPGPIPTLTTAEATERLHLYALTDR